MHSRRALLKRSDHLGGRLRINGQNRSAEENSKGHQQQRGRIILDFYPANDESQQAQEKENDKNEIVIQWPNEQTGQHHWSQKAKNDEDRDPVESLRDGGFVGKATPNGQGGHDDK